MDDAVQTSDSTGAMDVPAAIAPQDLSDRISGNPRLNFIHVDHTGLGHHPDDNIITLSRHDPALRRNLVIMANAGFHLYVLRGGVSSMVRHRRIATLWNEVVSGDVAVDENGIFTRLQAAIGQGEPRLLVVFSSIAGTMYTPSLMRHFEQNFASIQKYVPHNTHVLRIADFGGVVGAFYLNCYALPRNEDHIAANIHATAAKLGVADANIVLYGTSKGGTAASFYALRQGWRAVAVDPILSDRHYVEDHNDLHFTVPTFAQTKQDRFRDLVSNIHPNAQMSVICSDQSPQFPYITDTLINRFRDRFLFLNSRNLDIRTHPDVGPKTLPHSLSQINLHLAGLPMASGLHLVW